MTNHHAFTNITNGYLLCCVDYNAIFSVITIEISYWAKLFAANIETRFKLILHEFH